MILFSGCTLTNKAELKDENLKSVSIRFPIPIIEAGQTPFYVALNKGYYKEEGLDVKFNHGSPELNPIKMVSTNADDFGLVGGPDLLLTAKGKGQQLKALAIFHKNANFVVLIALKSSGITKLRELEGKKVGFYYGHISTDILRSLFHKEKINVSEVDIGFDHSQLISGQIDAAHAFRQTQPINLEAKGIETNIIDPH
ncbi:MAG: ABC transporter substrate-binding protein, partial [Candidatus Diapherotrites archaeon]|nr:ABC transporter substrate-binding protein [Candidatus Diapherotrites archaeon]